MNEFKKCTLCSHRWHSRKDFLEDPSAELIGYQVSFEDLSLGLFLFNHLECGTTIGIPAGNFKDLYNGPVFQDRLLGTEQCPEYCLHDDQLDPCPSKCECAYVREIMQVVRFWQKKTKSELNKMFAFALTRKPGRNFNQGLTTANLGPPNYELILKQHACYVDALKTIGVEVIELDPQPAYPDAHFVEDTAVVIPEVAVITRPGAISRQGEKESIAEVLRQYREIEYIQAPGTLDGGDVLMIGNHFFIGISERTNSEGAQQLGGILEKYGKTWRTIQVGAGLHFKSSVNYGGKNSILVTQDYTSHEALNGYDKIMVDKEEEYSANTLWINNHLLMPKGFPGTKTKLKSLGLPIIELDVSEMQKMDGGLTCLSIRF